MFNTFANLCELSILETASQHLLITFTMTFVSDFSVSEVTVMLMWSYEYCFLVRNNVDDEIRSETPIGTNYFSLFF